MKLSVSMIVKNEESCLATCLASVQGADEIVIVDTGSTDKTIEIAKSFGATVYSGEEYLWTDNYALSRNQSLSLCTGDWILIIDADETLESSIEEVRAEIEATKKDAIYFKTESKTKQKEWHPSIRAFKRIPGIFWKRRIHNCLSITDGQLPVKLLLRYGYSEAHKLDPDRALRILTRVVEEEPDCKRERFYLAREYWYRRKYPEAIEHYTAYLRVATWAPEMADAWLMLSRCLWAMGEGEAARSMCLQAIKINTNFSEAINFMADMSGPKNRARWKAWAATATDEDVLFIRDNSNLKLLSKKED